MAWSPRGWRRAAILNTIGILIFAALASGLLGWSSSRAGGVEANFIFYEGNCHTSNKLNLWLHLLLNVFSTAVLASSNFFMQVLSSPSRSEVDAAHRKHSSMDIGVPSFRNLFHISRFKAVAWLLFFASSIPIHLFFNSAIFSTEYQGSQWNLTVASEGFVNGAQYFPPGASLWPAGGEESGSLYISDEGYGFVQTVNTYFDSNSTIVKTIDFTAQSARNWKRIEVPECLSQYQYCSSRAEYGDVVMVVRSQDPSSYMVSSDNSLGWTRDKLFTPLDDDEQNIWNRHVPAAETNSLWFTANCSTTSDLNPRTHRAEGCFQTCNAAYGKKDSGFGFLSPDKIPASYTFDFFTKIDKTWPIYNITWPGLSDPSAAMLDLQYCLAQEIHPPCKVGLANKLLLIVIICVAIKTLLCVTVILRLSREDPLVVPGDAIASFITYPDEVTEGWCTVDRSLAREAFSAKKQPMTAQPQEWHDQGQRWYKAIPIAVWATDYLLFAAVIIFVGSMFGAAQSSNPIGSSRQTLEHSATNGILNTQGSTPGQLLPSVITANLPQLLLSFSYFVYNSLYTRLCVEKEWNSFSVDYRTLRVTSPEGQQRSTYRLQLPYRYSVPLITISILLHWLVSNALYVFILEGGYYWVDLSYNYAFNKPVSLGVGTGLSDDAYVGIGYSTMSLLVLFLVACVLATIPIILGARKMRSAMVIGGSNSFVISAACHVPILEEAEMAPLISGDTDEFEQTTETKHSREAPPDALLQAVTPYDSESGGLEMYRLLESQMTTRASNTLTHLDSEIIDNPKSEMSLTEISQGPLRWGSVRLPIAFYEHFADMDVIVGHLSFGAKAHGVEEPKVGQWYT